MRIVEDEGFCTCCGRYQELKYGEDNHSLVKKDLENYKKYKDLFVYECSNCGFISTNITGEEGVLYGDVKDGYEYKSLYEYAYLKGLDKELYDCHSADVPANMFEAYALVQLESKNYEMFVRVINKTIELKQIMLKKYKRSQDELGGEEENDDEYENLYNLINLSIDANRKQIDYYYHFAENKNVYLKLIYIENLVALNTLDEAKKVFEEVTDRYSLDKDLNNYFTTLLNN